MLCHRSRMKRLTTRHADANIFYHLETWRGSTTEPHTTVYLSQIRLFQRHVTTGAFKIAGGVDLSSTAVSTSRLVKQNPVPQTFVSRIAKAFLDTLYAFLDGMVHLASDESPKTIEPKSAPDVHATNEPNPLELLDIQNPVCQLRRVNFPCSLTIRAGHTPSLSGLELLPSLQNRYPEHDQRT